MAANRPASRSRVRRRGFAASEPSNLMLALRPAGLRAWFESLRPLQFAAAD